MNTTTVTIRSGYCSTCYLEGINRMCTGFTIPSSRRNITVTFPPLAPGLAASVRRAARSYIEANGPGDADRHPRHAAAGLL